MSGAWVTALAPCKVNPTLEVLGRRPDGFHEVDTTLLALELCDVVRVRRRAEPGIALSVCGPCATADVPVDGRNLAVRAAQFALELDRRSGGLEIELEKHVPSQAGLGGGSSDAAASLAAAERALDVTLGARGAQLLAELGSDCAFFRSASASGHARCTGRGEIVQVLPPVARELACVVVTPDCVAPTAAVYAEYARRLSSTASERSLRASDRREVAHFAAAPPFNRLEEAALAAVPRLSTWRSALEQLDSPERAPFRLAGSGASFFAFARSFESARALCGDVRTLLAHRGLAARGLWCLRAAGHGAVLCE
jgi:4-diphosphocytidyl-2-C-methyl-D-erythritol kinase